MNSAICIPDDPHAPTGVAPYPTPQTLRIGVGRRTLRMTGLADRLCEATVT